MPQSNPTIPQSANRQSIVNPQSPIVNGRETPARVSSIGHQPWYTFRSSNDRKVTLMKVTITPLVLALGLFLAPAAASAQMSARDRDVVEQISNQVNRYTQYTIFDSISASVEDGRVVLAGWVTMP